MIPIRYVDNAWSEVLQAITWYETQSPGLAADLVDEIQKILATLSDMPLRFPFIDRPVRIARTKRFPYGVFFYIDNDIIVVIAIMDLRRSPKRWKKRIPKKK